MTTVYESPELTGPAWPDEASPAEGDTTDAGRAPTAFFVPDLIQLEVGRGGRVLVVSDLHLGPTASEVSTRAADELAELLDGFGEPGMLVIAGDGFEMLAAAPDIAAILDSHPQFTEAVKRFADGKDHRVVVTPGNHDGQLAWDEESVALLTERLGVTDVGLACDLTVATGDGSQLVRVMHGHQFDQYNAFTDPRSPVDTPLGHHVVRQVLPKLASRDQPGSLLEGVRWCNGDPSAFLGSRLLYRMVAGWLWWLAVPFVAALVLRFMSFAPGVHPLLRHHAERWLVWFGILVVAIAVIVAVAGRRVDAQRGRPGRGRPAGLRGVRRPDQRPHPRAGDLPGRPGVLRQHRKRDRGSAGPEGPVRAAGAVPGRAAAVNGRVEVGTGAVGLTVGGRTPHRPAHLPRTTGSRAGAGPSHDA